MEKISRHAPQMGVLVVQSLTLVVMIGALVVIVWLALRWEKQQRAYVASKKLEAELWRH